jgi:hypothetical protein
MLLHPEVNGWISPDGGAEPKKLAHGDFFSMLGKMAGLGARRPWACNRMQRFATLQKVVCPFDLPAINDFSHEVTQIDIV